MLENALQGAVLRGETIEFTLNLAGDEENVGIGARELIDGGFNVLYDDGQTLTMSTPETIGGQVQFKWSARFVLEFAYDVTGCRPELVRVDRTRIMEQAVDLVQLKLNPAEGRQYAVTNFQLRRAQRLPVNRGFYVQQIYFTVSDYWRRI